MKELINKVEYKDAIANFNKELEKNPEVRKAAKHYKKSTKDIVKALQCRIIVRRYSDKSMKLVSINFTDKDSKISIKLSQTYKQNEA